MSGRKKRSSLSVGEWLRSHRMALLVATAMFALMAVMMAESLFLDRAGVTSAPVEGRHDVLAVVDPIPAYGAALWIWRFGGLVTWPVFMALMLLPFSRRRDGGADVIAETAVVSSLYGGVGLWVLSAGLRAFSDGLGEWIPVYFSFLFAISLLVLPFLYVWGFVWLYGRARERIDPSLASVNWRWPSLGWAVAGVYGIGLCVYVALAAVLVPVGLVMSGGTTDVVAWHACVDLVAIALSTGNFVSQWLAFYEVDKMMSDAEASRSAGRFRVSPPAPGGARQAAALAAADRRVPASKAPSATRSVPVADPRLPSWPGTDALLAASAVRERRDGSVYASIPDPGSPDGRSALASSRLSAAPAEPDGDLPAAHAPAGPADRPDKAIFLPDGRVVLPDGTVYDPSDPTAF